MLNFCFLFFYDGHILFNFELRVSQNQHFFVFGRWHLSLDILQHNKNVLITKQKLLKWPMHNALVINISGSDAKIKNEKNDKLHF